MSPRGSRAASWTIPHVFGLVQRDFRCSICLYGSLVRDSCSKHRIRARLLSRLLKTRLHFAYSELQKGMRWRTSITMIECAFIPLPLQQLLLFLCEVISSCSPTWLRRYVAKLTL
eukprot:scaffold312_cov409-Pavlova_lutheri.AAC.17